MSDSLLGLRLRGLSRVLEDALGAGIVDELAAGHEPFPHRDFAPGAESVGNIGVRRSRGYLFIGRLIIHGRHSRQAVVSLSMSGSLKKWTVREALSIVRFMNRSTTLHHRKDAQPHAQR